jgi:hypothetical protein
MKIRGLGEDPSGSLDLFFASLEGSSDGGKFFCYTQRDKSKIIIADVSDLNEFSLVSVAG